MNTQLDPAILSAALSGLETKKQELEAHIAAVRALLGHRGPGRPPSAEATPTSESQGRIFKRSPATRRRMAAAQRKRYKKLSGDSTAKPQPTKKAAAPKKRVLSAAGRKRIADAARKRWALITKQGETPKEPVAVAKKRAPRPAVRAVPTIVRRTVKTAPKKSAPKARKAAAPVRTDLVAASE